MNGYERLEFRLGEYLLRASSVNLKCLGEACFRDDIARTNTAHEGIDMICVRGHRTISLREGSHENTAQIAPKCLTAAHCAGIDAAKKAATRGNRCGASGKTFQCRSRKEGSAAATRTFI